MNGSTARRLAAGAAALLVVGGGGAAIAAVKAGGPDQQAILDDAAKRLGVTSDKLKGALVGALSDRLDAAVEAGKLTQAQADALKQRLQSGDVPLFRGGHRGGFGHFGLGFGRKLDAAARYLGMTKADLRTALQGGKTLAQVAQDKGKSVDGLVDALVADLKSRLDKAVQAGKLTQAQEDRMLADAKTRITAMVNGQKPAGPGGFGRGRHGGGFGQAPQGASFGHRGGGRFL